MACGVENGDGGADGGGGFTCQNGECGCGGPGQSCCADRNGDLSCLRSDLVCASGICQDPSPPNCGGIGKPCCTQSYPARVCQSGATCDVGTSGGGQCGTDCGEPGQPCCSLGGCADGGCCVENDKTIGTGVGANLTCVTGGACANASIAGCGRPGQPCCSIPGFLPFPGSDGTFCTSDSGFYAVCSSNGLCPGTTDDAGTDQSGCGRIGQPCCDVYEGVGVRPAVLHRRGLGVQRPASPSGHRATIAALPLVAGRAVPQRGVRPHVHLRPEQLLQRDCLAHMCGPRSIDAARRPRARLTEDDVGPEDAQVELERLERLRAHSRLVERS